MAAILGTRVFGGDFILCAQKDVYPSRLDRNYIRVNEENPCSAESVCGCAINALQSSLQLCIRRLLLPVPIAFNIEYARYGNISRGATGERALTTRHRF